MKVYKFLSIGILVLIGGFYMFSSVNYMPSDYIRWVIDTDNRIRKIKTVGDITIDLQYKPIPFVIANELRQNKIQKKVFDKRKEELSGAQYFTLKLKVDPTKATDITKYNVDNIARHQERLYYLSYQMQNDIQLVEGNDTLSTQLYHFERSYDIAPHRTFVLAFNANEINKGKDKTFILDSEQFGTGPIKIKFAAKDLTNLPTLKLQ